MIAKSGHLSSQSLQQIQSCGLAATTLSFSSSSRTFFGQKWTQIPHPLHQSRLMTCSFSFNFAISVPALFLHFFIEELSLDVNRILDK
jgi:hypothetical protein